MNWPIWRGGKLTTAATWRPIRFFRRVVLGDLRGRFLDADLGAEIDLELEGGLARLRKGLGLDDGAGADIDFEEIVEGDRRGMSVGCVMGLCSCWTSRASLRLRKTRGEASAHRDGNFQPLHQCLAVPQFAVERRHGARHAGIVVLEPDAQGVGMDLGKAQACDIARAPCAVSRPAAASSQPCVTDGGQRECSYSDGSVGGRRGDTGERRLVGRQQFEPPQHDVEQAVMRSPSTGSALKRFQKCASISRAKSAQNIASCRRRVRPARQG